MARNNFDFYTKVKYHLIQIFLLIMLILGMYEFLKYKFPYIPWPF